MSKKLMLASGLGLALLAGCTQGINPTDTDRAIIGAAAGATIAKVDGRSNSDLLKGAAIGGAAGALCDDVGLCQPTTPRRRY